MQAATPFPFMTPGIGDAHAIARYLVQCPVRDWQAEGQRIIGRAIAGTKHQREHGRPHPQCGDGSLMAAALQGIRKPETNAWQTDPSLFWSAMNAATQIIHGAYLNPSAIAAE